MTLNPLHYYVSPTPYPGTFDSLFGGFFLIKGIPLIGQLGTLVSFAVALAACVAYHQNQSPRWKRLAFAASLACYSGLWFFLLQPWDEVFINLRHSLHLVQEGKFSFNRFSWDEGTVDFLPYALLGLLHRWGMPLLEGAFLMSYAGGIACLAAAARFLPLAQAPKLEPLAFLFLSLFPPLIFNAASGFAATVFTACVMWILYGLFIGDSPKWGLMGLALLPWLRVEAALLSILLFLLWGRYRRISLLNQGLGLAATTAPIVALTVYRAVQFGHLLPTPVRYKAATGSLFFFAVGIRNAIGDAVASHAVTLLLALFCFRHLLPEVRLANERILYAVLSTLAVFTAPYYLSGGDWFPSYWGRYFLPLSFWLCILVAIRAMHAWTHSTRRGLILTGCVGGVFFLISSLWPISSTWKMAENFFSHRRTLARIHAPTISRGHYRIQNLSQLGAHFKATTRPTDRIGSSELATIMFYADRDTVDYLGLVNSRIADAPLRPMPSLLRKFPYRSELPYLIFKRLDPAELGRTLPEILYTFDFMLRDQIDDLRPYELSTETLKRALSRWERQLGGLMDPLYGGVQNIQSLGYEAVLIRAGDEFMNLYFVHHKARDFHFAQLEKSGFVKCSRLDGPCAAK